MEVITAFFVGMTKNVQLLGIGAGALAIAVTGLVHVFGGEKAISSAGRALAGVIFCVALIMLAVVLAGIVGALLPKAA